MTRWLRFDSVSSTQDLAWEEFPKQKETSLVVVAKSQSQGRGRQGRSWNSTSKQNLYFSFASRWNAPADRMALVTLLAGLSVFEVVRDFKLRSDISGNFFLKWPNDLYFFNQPSDSWAKVGGILSEARKDTVVIGFGLNLKEAPQVGITTSAIAELCDIDNADEEFSEKVIHKIVTRFEDHLNAFRSHAYQMTPQQSAILTVAFAPNVGEKGEYLASHAIKEPSLEATVESTIESLDSSNGALHLKDASGRRFTAHSGEFRFVRLTNHRSM